MAAKATHPFPFQLVSPSKHEHNVDEEPPSEPPMELVERVGNLERDVAVIKATMATKADIADVRADISKWMLATTLTIIGTVLAAVFGLAKVYEPPKAQVSAPTSGAPTVNYYIGPAAAPPVKTAP